MIRNLVPFAMAATLKHLGFGETCYFHYMDDGSVLPINPKDPSMGLKYSQVRDKDHVLLIPTYDQVVGWMREEKGLFICINLGYTCIVTDLNDSRDIDYGGETIKSYAHWHIEKDGEDTCKDYDEIRNAAIEFCLKELQRRYDKENNKSQSAAAQNPA